MAFDDDNDENMNSDDDQDQDEEMEMEEDNPEPDQDMDDGGDEDDDGDGDGDDGDDDDDDDDANEADSPSRRAAGGPQDSLQRSGSQERSADGAREGSQRPDSGVLGPKSSSGSAARSPHSRPAAQSWIPPVRELARHAQAYDIVPTMAAPQGTSINAIAATPDMKWVFSGGTDGYVRMYNWVETANGKVPLTVAQKHPFVDSVMKAGSLVTYWENEDAGVSRTPPPATGVGAAADEGKWTSPVYSLAVQHQALWLLSGLESGGINLQTCRHQAGTRITTLKEHTNAVSVLSLSQDETNLLSGSWDKMIHDWDLHTGKVKRSYRGSGGQISAIEVRPLSGLSIPEVSDLPSEPILNGSGTFSSNNADKPFANGTAFMNGFGNAEDDAGGSPDGSLFGEGDHGSLFGEDNAGGAAGAGGGFDDDNDLARALESEMQEGAELNTNMAEVDGDAAAQPIDTAEAKPVADATGASEAATDAPAANTTTDAVESTTAAASEAKVEEPQDVIPSATSTDPPADPAPTDAPTSSLFDNDLSNSDKPPTAPPTEDRISTSDSATEAHAVVANGGAEGDLPPQSESTFLDAAQDGTLRIWDRRMPSPIATLTPYGATPPWCTGACWSPDGNFFYAGRRNGTVEEFSVHKLGDSRSEPNRIFKFQQGSGPVYAVRAMPNRRHLLCASNDILRIYDLKQADDSARHKAVPFTIVPGHRGGAIAALYIDPACRFMLSASGNRGWEGASTEVLLGYEIGVQDDKDVWHK